MSCRAAPEIFVGLVPEGQRTVDELMILPSGSTVQTIQNRLAGISSPPPPQRNHHNTGPTGAHQPYGPVGATGPAEGVLSPNEDRVAWRWNPNGSPGMEFVCYSPIDYGVPSVECVADDHQCAERAVWYVVEQYKGVLRNRMTPLCEFHFYQATRPNFPELP